MKDDDKNMIIISLFIYSIILFITLLLLISDSKDKAKIIEKKDYDYQCLKCGYNYSTDVYPITDSYRIKKIECDNSHIITIDSYKDIKDKWNNTVQIETNMTYCDNNKTFENRILI